MLITDAWERRGLQVSFAHVSACQCTWVGCAHENLEACGRGTGVAHGGPSTSLRATLWLNTWLLACAEKACPRTHTAACRPRGRCAPPVTTHRKSRAGPQALD